ncbi:MAG: hypothetical protein ACI9TY_000410 [Alphaproteobacteria bacterium]|jgi:hypothetical protein
MTRSKFRKLWLISLSIMMAATMYSHNKYEDVTQLIDRKIRHVEKLTIERRSGGQVTSALADLDSRTINEKSSTRLDILRYLGLAESHLDIVIGNSFDKKIGRTPLVTRSINVYGKLPYAEALNQLDYFHNTKKVSITFSSISPSTGAYGDIVIFSLGGTIYGLSK